MSAALARRPTCRPARRAVRTLPVQALLEWAFMREKAQLELPDRRKPEERGFGYGMEFVLLRQAQLGCRVDGGGGGGPRDVHHDAEVVAAVLAGLPDALGGRGMAVRVAEMARAGMTPDWMPGAVPRCVPAEVKRNQHGDRAKTIIVGVERVLHRGRWRQIEVRACPISWDPHPARIAGARNAYLQWWHALKWLQSSIHGNVKLVDHELSDSMPSREPWNCK